MGLLILRVVVGAIMIGHGTQKLLGWFEGHGLEGTAGFLGKLGYRKPDVQARVVGGAETFAGIGILFGFLTPFAAAALIGVMINAIWTVHRGNGLWASDGGFEYNLVLAAIAAMLGFAGPGPLSLDAVIGWDLAGLFWGIVTLALGVGAGAAVLATWREERAVAPTERQEQADEDRLAA